MIQVSVSRKNVRTALYLAGEIWRDSQKKNQFSVATENAVVVGIRINFFLSILPQLDGLFLILINDELEIFFVSTIHYQCSRGIA